MRCTLMRDLMVFEAPLGLPGKIAESLLLRSHMWNLLKRRNEAIKQAAESDHWQTYLGD
jgi:hypothetical protein